MQYDQRSTARLRQRFRKLGLDGLKDAPRSEKPVTITTSQKAMVIQKVCEKPTGGYTNRSQKRIAEQVGISQSKVHQILKKAEQPVLLLKEKTPKRFTATYKRHGTKRRCVEVCHSRIKILYLSTTLLILF